MYICENCGEKFEEWRKKPKKGVIPRFCSLKCKQNFAVKEATRVNTGKVSWNKGITGEELKKHSSYKRKTRPKSILDLSSRTAVKILSRMKIGCSYCNRYVEGAVWDIHHILEKKNGGTNDMSNLTYICPTCHRLAHSGIIKPVELKPMSETAPNWENNYYG